MRRLSYTALLGATLYCTNADADYFLHADQQADIFTHGAMTGEDGARYDLWIVPGYVGSVHDAASGWRHAGHDFATYGHKDLYQDTFDTSKDVLHFASYDTVGHFAFRGSYSAWKDAFASAQARTHRRVFGWWFAYPWAVIEATGESLVRVGLGVPGGILIGGVGATLIPAGEMVWPAIKGVYHATIPGTVMPIAAVSWTTVIAPPMALLGQQPTAERADGFWLKRIDPIETDPELLATKSALGEWREHLVATPELQTIHQQLHSLQVDYDKKRDETLHAMSSQFAADKSALDTKWQDALFQQAGQHEKELDSKVDREKLLTLSKRHGRKPLLDALKGDGLSELQANALLDRLLGTASQTQTEDSSPQLRPDNEKTNPLKRSLQLGTGLTP